MQMCAQRIWNKQVVGLIALLVNEITATSIGITLVSVDVLKDTQPSCVFRNLVDVSGCNTIETLAHDIPLPQLMKRQWRMWRDM